jgi:hypothetical protein
VQELRGHRCRHVLFQLRDLPRLVSRPGFLTREYLVFFLIPAFALAMQLLTIYRRENYFIKHLVYSIHYWSFLFVYFAVAPILFGLLNQGYKWIAGAPLFASYDGWMFLTISAAGIVPYTWFALRKVFCENAWTTTAKTLAILFLTGYLFSRGIGLTYYVTYLAVRG